jgi:hypothetical protein
MRSTVWALAAVGTLAVLAVAVLIARLSFGPLHALGGGTAGKETQGGPAVAKAHPRVDPCDPNAPLPPPDRRPVDPDSPPPKDPNRPAAAPDPEHAICSVTIRNETGKPLRIWRMVDQPRGHTEFLMWRRWMACKNTSPSPPPAVAGWTYFVVENIEDNIEESAPISYYIVGWRYLAYGGFHTIRIKPNFFDAPDSEDAFVITSLALK